MNDNIISQLCSILGSNNILLEAKQEYCQDWRGNFTGIPLAVIFPYNIEQIVKVIKLCQQYKLSVVTQGGNTSLCGGAVPDASGQQILINLKYFNKILSIDCFNNSITVEAGCTLAQVQKYAIENNLLYPLSLPSENYCTIGGNLSTNAGGVGVLKYGNSRNLCLGIKAVMPDASIYNGLFSLYKNNMGYDIKQLLIGAEGTLGIITSASLRLYPLPYKYHAILLCFDSFNQIINVFKNLQNYYAHTISSFEIMNAQSINCIHMTNEKLLVDANINYSQNINAWYVLIELEQHGQIIDINYLRTKYAKHILAYETYIPSQPSKLWAIRHEIPIAQKALGGNIKHDISLTLEAMPEFIQNIPNKINLIDNNAKFIIFGHIGDGNLHYNIVSEEKFKLPIQDLIHEQVIKFGGSIAAEHGIGRIKTVLLKESINNTQYILAKTIKNTLDENNLFNPHVIFE